MTKHSIKELERQLAAAKSRLVEAQTSVAKAKDALYVALEKKRLDEYATKGIRPGDKVRVLGLGRSKHQGIMFFAGMKRNRASEPIPDLRKVNKDGTMRATPSWLPPDVDLERAE